LLVPDLDQIAQSVPMAELALGFFFTAGTATGTGSFTFTPTVAFGDDASTVKSSRVAAPITVIVTSGVLIPQYAQIPLGWTSNHKYIKVSWAIALSVITGLSITNFTVALENEPDSGIGRVGTNAA
jgi:hypothetical protein